MAKQVLDENKWMPEKEVLALLGWKHYKTLRSKVYKGILPINITAPSHEERKYSREDVYNYLDFKAKY